MDTTYKQEVRATLLAALLALVLHPAVPAAQAQATPTRALARCSRTMVEIRNRLLAVDTRRLSRCAVAVLEPAWGGDPERRCRDLHTPGSGLDRKDTRVRRRMSKLCRNLAPAWLPETCQGPGLAAGMRLADADDLALCIASSTHCLAAQALLSLFGDIRTVLAEQNPANLELELGGIAGNNFASCMNVGTTTTTTTTTPSAPSTSTTTTTLASTSTTIAAATTTTISAPASTTTSTTLPGTEHPPRLVITEIMNNPSGLSDTQGEYFEIFNTGQHEANLEGIEISDADSDGFTIESFLGLPPGAFLVLGRSTAAAGGNVDYVYGNAMTLANGVDEIIVSSGDTVIDSVFYDQSFPALAGRSLELAATAFSADANDMATNWCLSSTPLADGDTGSPGTAGLACAP